MQAIKTPGHPNLVTSIAMIPPRTSGVHKAAKNIGDLTYIVLKSLDSRLIIFPIYCDLAVYCESFDNF